VPSSSDENAFMVDPTASHNGACCRASEPEGGSDQKAGVQAVIDRDGAFITSEDLAAFICR
jgi:hypothetical protein